MSFDGDIIVDVDAFLKLQYQKISAEKKILHDIFNFIEKNDDTSNDSLNRLDRKPEHLENSHFSNAQKFCQNENNSFKAMVRYGEFSPLNPAFQLTNRPLVGLGEYEEKRKRFLAKKKREYLEYLSKAKDEKEQRKTELKISAAVGENKNATESSCANSVQGNPKTFQENFTLGGSSIDETDRCYTRWQQMAYKRELDKQISEKRKRLNEDKQLERNEEEKKQMETMMWRDQNANNVQMLNSNWLTSNHLSNEEENQRVFYRKNTAARNADVAAFDNLEKNSIDISIFGESDSNHASKCNINDETQPIHTNTDFLKQSYLSNESAVHPVSKCAAYEQCEAGSVISSNAMADFKLHQRLQQQRYKNDLAKQIEEKNQLKMEREFKEKEEEKRSEWKAKHEAEMLRREYEKEQAELDYRATRKVQLELRHEELTRNVQEKKNERKKTVEQISAANLTKPFTYPASNHETTDERGIFENDSCSIENKTRRDELISNANPKSDYSVIVNATYVLAVEDESFPENSVAQHNAKRPSSPPVPAIATKNILNSLSRIEDTIPSTVSMSKTMKKQFLKNSTVLSSLSEIRKKLLEKRIYLSAK